MHKNLLIVLLIFSGCSQQKDTTSGGSCTYRYDTLPVQLVAINSIGSNRYDLLFIPVTADIFSRDTISYYAVNGDYVSASLIKEKNIAPGDTLAFIKGTIVSGSCNPNNDRVLAAHFQQ